MKKPNPIYKKIINKCADYVIEKTGRIVAVFTAICFVVVTLAVVLTWTKGLLAAVLIVLSCGIILPLNLAYIGCAIMVHLSQTTDGEDKE